MTESDGLLRAQAFEAYEAIPSLDAHGELTRLILTEVSLLTEKYRNVRRHDIPHIREISGLLDVLWQEVEMECASLEQGLTTCRTAHRGASLVPLDRRLAGRRRASHASTRPPAIEHFQVSRHD